MELFKKVTEALIVGCLDKTVIIHCVCSIVIYLKFTMLHHSGAAEEPCLLQKYLKDLRSNTLACKSCKNVRCCGVQSLIRCGHKYLYGTTTATLIQMFMTWIMCTNRWWNAPHVSLAATFPNKIRLCTWRVIWLANVSQRDTPKKKSTGTFQALGGQVPGPRIDSTSDRYMFGDNEQVIWLQQELLVEKRTITRVRVSFVLNSNQISNNFFPYAVKKSAFIISVFVPNKNTGVSQWNCTSTTWSY